MLRLLRMGPPPATDFAAALHAAAGGLGSACNAAAMDLARDGVPEAYAIAWLRDAVAAGAVDRGANVHSVRKVIRDAFRAAHPTAPRPDASATAVEDDPAWTPGKGRWPYKAESPDAYAKRLGLTPREAAAGLRVAARLDSWDLPPRAAAG